MTHISPRGIPTSDTGHRVVLDQLTRLEDEIASLQKRLAWTRSDAGDPLSRDLTTGLPNRRSLQGYLERHTRSPKTSRGTMWVFILAVTTTKTEPASSDGSRRHRWFRDAGNDLAAVVADRGLVGRWSTDEIVVLIPSPSDSVRARIGRRIRSVRNRLPAGLTLELRQGDLDPARVHDPSFDLVAALRHADG